MGTQHGVPGEGSMGGRLPAGDGLLLLVPLLPLHRPPKP
jgi:hypothetical protein